MLTHSQPHACITLPLPVRWVQRLEFPHKLGVCERVFAKKLAAHGTCWVHTSTGRLWKLDLKNPTLRWIIYGKYEGAPFLTWAARILPRNGTVVDSGANIGQMLLYFADYVPDGKIFAFEPGSHQADWLAECLAVNPDIPARLFRLALGDKEQTAFLDSQGPAHTHGSWNKVTGSGNHSIQVVCLSRVLEESGVDCVHLWKLDVEGYEVPALQGAGKWLQEKRIRALWIEMVGENGKRINEFMNSVGYSPFILDRRGSPEPMVKPPAHANVLFLPR